MSKIAFESVEIENLRGFYSAALSLRRSRTLVVGPNNSGKTSLLRLLDWGINQSDDDIANQSRVLSAAEGEFLLPARDARHRARRLTLTVRLSDRRTWKKFKCDRSGRAQIRFNIRLTPKQVVYLRLGRPERGEKAETDTVALELIRRVRDAIHYIYIPSFRDAGSSRFNSTLHDVMRTRIEDKALHSSRAGSPKEHRDVAGALKTLRRVMLGLTQPLWNDAKASLPPGMAKDAKLDLNLDQSELIGILESKLSLQISTGTHDALTVPMTELGSGLQSLLDLAFQDSEKRKDVKVIVAVEEPEAFLHPSAQRLVSRRLLADQGPLRSVVVTTHSATVVEEAEFGDLVLCRNHRFYEPTDVPDVARLSINTALLSGFGAEMAFGNSVLLVEGEGDRQFFERLRRRISSFEASGDLDACFVVPVGGKARFSPWMTLLNSYGMRSDRPIEWLVAADSDASSEARSAFARAGIRLRQEQVDSLSDITIAKNSGDIDAWRKAVRNANLKLRRSSTRLHFVELDLEEAALSSASDGLLKQVCNLANWNDNPTRDEIMARLGAKAFGSGEGKKDVHIRGFIGQNISPEDLSANVRRCLERWFGSVIGENKAKRILTTWKN